MKSSPRLSASKNSAFVSPSNSSHWVNSMAPRIAVCFAHYFGSQTQSWRFLGQEFSLEREFQCRPPFWKITTAKRSGKVKKKADVGWGESKIACLCHNLFSTFIFPMIVSVSFLTQKFSISCNFPSFLSCSVANFINLILGTVRNPTGFRKSSVLFGDLQNNRQMFGDRQFWAMCTARANQNLSTVVPSGKRFEESLHAASDLLL